MAVLANTVTTTAVDGKIVTIRRDTTGGGWFDQVETRVQAADNSRTHTTTTYARSGVTIIARTTETISTDGLTRNELTDADGNTYRHGGEPYHQPRWPRREDNGHRIAEYGDTSAELTQRITVNYGDTSLN